MKRFGKNGISILEISIATLILAVVAWMATRTLKAPGQEAESILVDTALQESLFSAMENLLKVGKLAGTLDGSCFRAAPGSLECFVDRGVPPSGVSSKVRFHLQNNTLLYQKYEAKNWVDQLKYEGITGFDICQDDDMKAGTCPLEPIEISKAHTVRAGPLFRYFRVRLTAVSQSKSGVPRTAQLQSAFFVRNPAFPDGNYQWGFQ